MLYDWSMDSNHSTLFCCREFLKSETTNPNPARIPPQTPPAGGKSAEAGRILFPQKNCFAPPSPFRFLLRDFPQNTFELCPTNTSLKRNRNSREKYGRREAPSVLHSPRRIQNSKGFSTLRVAQKVRLDPSFESSNRIMVILVWWMSLSSNNYPVIDSTNRVVCILTRDYVTEVQRR